MVSETDGLRFGRSFVAGAFLAALLAAGCGSESRIVVGPTTSRCAVAAAADTAAFPSDGGSGHISVAVNRECGWSASTPHPWIQLSGPTTGQGEARVSFSVVANGDPAARSGEISIGDQRVAITQAAAACRFEVDPRHANLPPAGGRGTVQVTASSPLCGWTARSDTAWLAIVEGGQGTGSGQVHYEVPSATGPPRQGSMTVAGFGITVAQGDGCATAVSPAALTLGADGGPGAASVTAGAGCAWTASSAASWITITAGAIGSGPGDVRLAVAANTGPGRSGTVTIGGHPLVVSQASGCRVTIAPASQAFPADGGSGSVAIAAGAECGWAASSGAPWIAIAAGPSGSGAGDVRYQVAANTGPARSGTVTIAGQTLAISQASGCRAGIAPASQVFAAGGGGGTLAVTIGAGCPWTATASQPWVQITAGATGTGSGTVAFAIAPHDGPARQASLAVDGQLFTIQQESGCAFTLSAPGIAFEPGGGGGTVVVLTAEGCAWTASAAEPWIQISAGGSGIGPGPVNFFVTANPGPERAGVITAGGQPFMVRQTGAP